MNGCTNIPDSQANFRIVSVLNHGGFIANVQLFYSYQGRRFHFENRDLLLLQEFRENVPLEATNVNLSVYVTDVFTGTHLLFSKSYAKADDACFLLWGLSFNPQYQKIQCTGPGVLQSFLPPAVIVPPKDMCHKNCIQ